MTTAIRPHAPSRRCYQAGCRADGCVLEAYRYRKQLDLEHARGMRRLRDATQTRVHIQRLTFAGWTQAQIATASGVSSMSIHKLHNGSQSSIAHWRAAAILNIHIGPPPADEKHVDATGSMRRLRALSVIGHSLTSLAPRLDMTRDRLKVIANTPTVRVRTEEAAAIARLYRRLAAVPGTNQQVRTFARNRGWHGPLAWDDIDNPQCQPEIDLHPDKRGRPAKVDETRVLRLTDQGLSAEQIAWELGCHERTVIRARNRARTEQLFGTAA
ncbi:helix-turn-helix domain-containing protein [Streptomyces sp. NPDC002402]